MGLPVLTYRSRGTFEGQCESRLLIFLHNGSVGPTRLEQSLTEPKTVASLTPHMVLPATPTRNTDMGHSIEVEMSMS